jgi:hypothetical protein
MSFDDEEANWAPCVNIWVPVTCGGYFGSGYTPEYALRFAVLTRGFSLGLCLDFTQKTEMHVGQLTSKQKQDLAAIERLVVFTHEHELGPAPPGTSNEGLPVGPPANGGPAAPLVAQVVEFSSAEAEGHAEGDDSQSDAYSDMGRWPPEKEWECCQSCDMKWYARMYGQEAADEAYKVQGEIY